MQKPRLRAILSSADGRWLAAKGEAVHLAFPVPARGTNYLSLKLPFVSDLDDRQASELEGTDYDSQRKQVIAYWKEIVQPAARFSVPRAEIQRFSAIGHRAYPYQHDQRSKERPRHGSRRQLHLRRIRE